MTTKPVVMRIFAEEPEGLKMKAARSSQLHCQLCSQFCGNQNNLLSHLKECSEQQMKLLFEANQCNQCANAFLSKELLLVHINTCSVEQLEHLTQFGFVNSAGGGAVNARTNEFMNGTADAAVNQDDDANQDYIGNSGTNQDYAGMYITHGITSLANEDSQEDDASSLNGRAPRAERRTKDAAFEAATTAQNNFLSTNGRDDSNGGGDSSDIDDDSSEAEEEDESRRYGSAKKIGKSGSSEANAAKRKRGESSKGEEVVVKPEIKGEISRDLHPCQECDKSYSSENILKSHINITHLRRTGADKQCNLCGKVVCSFSYLVIHDETVHQGKKPYSCTFCEKSFSQSHTLKTHVESIHQGVRHQCTSCDKSYNSKAQLNTHMKEKH